MGFCQGFGLVCQVSHLGFALTTLHAEITKLAEHTPALLEQLAQFALEMATTDLVFATPLEFIVGTTACRLHLGFYGRQVSLGRPNGVLGHR